MTVWQIPVADEMAMESLGQQLAPVIIDAGVVYLAGDLGAGKTTLVRGILRGLGYQGAVKSPTFSLVEPYIIGTHRIYHFDLYRLNDPGELEFIGVREYFASGGLCLLEWPEKGRGFLPPPDINVMIHKVKQGRNVRLELNSDRGAALADALTRTLEKQKGMQCT
jgi:tRNA threonylcarbamoyladenosine biosynthesis protein TsaE